MLGTVHTTGPVRVHLDQHDNNSGAFGALFSAAVTLAAGSLVFVWRAPLLALGVLLAAGSALTVWAGYGWVVFSLGLTLAAVAGSMWWCHPAWLRVLGDHVVGEALRVFVYRRRWETACLTSRATTRAGSTVHVPALVRHRRRHGVDALTVRMAPGQTLTDWRDACPALATTFGAYSVTADDTAHAGWITLTVQRRDPLAGERVALDPARSGAGPIELGRDEHGQPFTIDPTGTAHLGMQGATRSGKSSTCYTLLAALAHRSNVAVVGIDPSGLLLGAFEAGPNTGYIATGTGAADLDRAGDVLGRLVELLDQRVTELRAGGTDKITAFTPTLPAVWIVLEEYPALLAAARALDSERGAKPGQRLAPRLERAVGRLIKEGAKVGVCVLVLAQRMSADALATDDRSNLAHRITLRVDNGDAVNMLHDGINRAGIDAIRQFRPGVALVESPGEPLRRVRFHYTDYTRYRERVTAGLRHNGARIDSLRIVTGTVITPDGPAVPNTQPIPVVAGGLS